MQKIPSGTYFGITDSTWKYNGITLTDTAYTHDFVDWHYHENAYFTYLLQGGLYESGKQREHCLSMGGLLFHHSEEAHYNEKVSEKARGFHVEVEDSWFIQRDIQPIKGITEILHPGIKGLIDQIFLETKKDDEQSALGIESLLIQVFELLHSSVQERISHKPEWISILREFLHDSYNESFSLDKLGNTLGVHPVHISRQFPRHFGMNLSEYLRLLKLEAATQLLKNKELSLTQVALEAGFSDQSHFNRVFKKRYKMSPGHYRQQLLN